jgi:hypothetical protein
MELGKIYKTISGRFLGKFIFACAYEPDGLGRGRVGTLYYFSGVDLNNTINFWGKDCGIILEYYEYYDIKNPPLPPNIENA